MRCRSCGRPTELAGPLCGACRLVGMIGGRSMLNQWRELVAEDLALWHWCYGGDGAVG